MSIVICSCSLLWILMTINTEHLSDLRRSSYEGMAQAGCKEGVKDEPNSPWGGASTRENNHGLERDSPLGSNTRDMYSSEQLVPGHGTYQPYRYPLIIHLQRNCCKMYF